MCGLSSNFLCIITSPGLDALEEAITLKKVAGHVFTWPLWSWQFMPVAFLMRRLLNYDSAYECCMWGETRVVVKVNPFAIYERGVSRAQHERL